MSLNILLGLSGQVSSFRILILLKQIAISNLLWFRQIRHKHLPVYCILQVSLKSGENGEFGEIQFQPGSFCYLSTLTLILRATLLYIKKYAFLLPSIAFFLFPL